MLSHRLLSCVAPHVSLTSHLFCATPVRNAVQKSNIAFLNRWLVRAFSSEDFDDNQTHGRKRSKSAQRLQDSHEQSIHGSSTQKNASPKAPSKEERRARWQLDKWQMAQDPTYIPDFHYLKTVSERKSNVGFDDESQANESLQTSYADEMLKAEEERISQSGSSGRGRARHLEEQFGDEDIESSKDAFISALDEKSLNLFDPDTMPVDMFQNGSDLQERFEDWQTERILAQNRQLPLPTNPYLLFHAPLPNLDSAFKKLPAHLQSTTAFINAVKILENNVSLSQTEKEEMLEQMAVVYSEAEAAVPALEKMEEQIELAVQQFEYTQERPPPPSVPELIDSLVKARQSPAAAKIQAPRK